MKYKFSRKSEKDRIVTEKDKQKEAKNGAEMVVAVWPFEGIEFSKMDIGKSKRAYYLYKKI